MIRLYTDLKNEPSTNGKIEVIKARAQDDIVKMSLALCYDPYLNSFMKKVPNGSPGKLSYNETFPKFYELYQKLADRELTGNAAIEEVKSFLSTLDAESQALCTLILKKDLKVKIAAKIINKAFGGQFITEFNVQLGQPYDKDRSYGVPFWYVSRKLNGIRGYYDTGTIFTRKGHPVFGFDHIVKELDVLARELKAEFIDGELFDKNIPFQTIQSYVTTSKNIIPAHKEKIKFNVFAVGAAKKNGGWQDTAEMLKVMYAVDWSKFKYLTVLEYEKVSDNYDDIFSLMMKYADEGFEGLVLRSPTITYQWKRSHDLVKFKPFIENDFTIVGFEEGTPGTEIENTLGALLVEGEYQGKKIKAKVGSGFKIKEGDGVTRDWMWKSREELLSKSVEVKFQSVTDKPDEDGFWSILFPVFSKLKMDR